MTFKLSVVIPLYNKEKYIQRAIKSVLAQQLAVDEIVIVDDGSTDASVSQVEAIESNKIKLVRQSNQGVSVARNVGVNACKNDYVLLLDADDLWLTNFTEEITLLIKQYPQAALFATAYAFKEDQRIIPAKLKAVPSNKGLIPDYFLACIKADLPVTASSVALKKEAFLSIGGFPKGIKMGEDQLVWSKIAYQFPVAFSNTLCVYYDRSVDDSACKTNLITSLAPHVLQWQYDLQQHKVPNSLVSSLNKLLHFSALYCVKNNLILNNRVTARSILFNEPVLQRDIYWLVSVALTFMPQFIIKRVF